MPRNAKITAAGLAALTAATLMVASPTSARADETSDKGRITVSATGSAEVAPDMAIFTVGVLRQADTAREALDANNAAMAEVLAAMVEFGIAERDLQTSQFNIAPRYQARRDNQPNAQPLIVGYDVSNQLTVRIRDLDILGAVLDRAVTLGVNTGGGIGFTNAEPDAVLETARVEAMKAAIKKARVLTDAANVSLGRIVEISEHSNVPGPMMMARGNMAFAQDASVPMAAGENSYSVTVNVVFEIQQ